ncbi:hypothetical protein N1851_031142 [Merluccius polli]|uniref:Ig-like domain-containing protein n=1 Tax=Merluccius polli TaxID=89951 RepID=A0AA47M485_MERPO|nr:hypothetical protein N1851_031142 [Merluccius polli]
MFGIPPRSIGLLLVVFTHTALTGTHLTMSGVGHNVILSCHSSFGSCSDVTWYHQTSSGSDTVVLKAGRLYMDSNCDLHVDNITEADVGRYRCSGNLYDFHYLSIIITVSSVPTSGLVPGVNVTLHCRLLTVYGYGGCSYAEFQGVTLEWKDDIQQDSKPVIQKASTCYVLLTVTIQRDITFSCQALVTDRVQSTVEVPVLLPDGVPSGYVVIAVAVVGCFAMMVMLALIEVKKKRKTTLTDHLTMSGVGHNVILSCGSSFGSCSDVTWRHHHTPSGSVATIVMAGRFHMDSYCDLHIDNITQADVGRYLCSGNTYDFHYLSIITVSSVPTSGLVPGDRVTLRCSLFTYYGYGRCFYTVFRGVTLKWKDDIQQDSKPVIQSGSKCDVLLTVTIQRDITFSCQALVTDRVQSTLEVPVLLPDGVPSGYVVIAVAVVGCFAMMVMLALIEVKKKRKTTCYPSRTFTVC